MRTKTQKSSTRAPRRKRCSACSQLRQPEQMDSQGRCRTCAKVAKEKERKAAAKSFKTQCDAACQQKRQQSLFKSKGAAKQPLDPTKGQIDVSSGTPAVPPTGISGLEYKSKMMKAMLDNQLRPTYGDRQQSLADRLRKAKDPGTDTAPHLIIEARAGTGKTTTLIEGLKRVKGLETSLVPSPQQAAVWEQMELSKGKAQTICFVAFNKSIAEELKLRVPEGCEASTMHSMGFRAVRRTFPNVKVNSYRVQDIISELMERDIRELRKYKPEVLKATEELVSLCKMNLVGLPGDGMVNGVASLATEADDLSQLASYYDVDLNGNSQEVFALVPRVLERCKDVQRDNCCDFNDMIWLPVVLDLNVFKYDLLLIDEFQDCNRCQHALARKAGRRLICCGDPKQSIYGFAGADAESMARIERELKQTERGCVHLPLTVTRRCGKAIVKEAQRYVPDFEAFETNPEGRILHLAMKSSKERGSDCSHIFDSKNVCEKCGETTGYQSAVEDSDMILCRCNAPLVSECFRFIRAGRKANIQGRDVGQGLIGTIRKSLRAKGDDLLTGYTVDQLQAGLDDWLYAEERKENAKRNPSDQRLINLQDRYDCICCFMDGASQVAEVVKKIESIFTDDKNGAGIKLSSVHKAKGLEANRVFILRPEGAPMPHPMAKTDWERAQELNILYVAITRAIDELVYVS